MLADRHLYPGTGGLTLLRWTDAILACVFYLLTFLAGGLAVFARRGLVVNGDAAVPATNIVAHQSLFQLGFAADLLA